MTSDRRGDRRARGGADFLLETLGESLIATQSFHGIAASKMHIDEEPGGGLTQRVDGDCGQS
jgi:hypothetical protein